MSTMDDQCLTSLAIRLSSTLMKWSISICIAYALLLTFNVLKYHPRHRSLLISIERRLMLKPGSSVAAAAPPPLPPGSLGLPLLGETLEFIRCFTGQNPDLFWKRRTSSKNYKGLFRTHLFGQPTICVTTPKLAKSVLMNDSLFGLGWPESVAKLLGAKSFLSSSGEVHKRLRRFGAASIKTTDSLKRVLPVVQALCQKAFKSWEDKSEVAILSVMSKLTFNIISKIVLGYEPGEEVDALQEEVNRLVHGFLSLPIDLPGTPFNRALKARRQLLLRVQGIMKARRISARKGDEEAHGDILESLMAVKDESGRGLEDDEILDTVLIFLVAGEETTAYALMWILYFLHKHPEALHKLKEEHQQLHKLKGDGEMISLSDIKSMTYMSKVINETLRIVNLAPFTCRRALSDVDYNGATIPKGWIVQVWFRGIHLDPTIFENPYEFKPERWTDEKLELGAYIPFGAGARSCLGADLSKLEMYAIIYHFVQNCSWEPVDPNCKITNIPFSKPVDGYRVYVFKHVK